MVSWSDCNSRSNAEFPFCQSGSTYGFWHLHRGCDEREWQRNQCACYCDGFAGGKLRVECFACGGEHHAELSNGFWVRALSGDGVDGAGNSVGDNPQCFVRGRHVADDVGGGDTVG